MQSLDASTTAAARNVAESNGVTLFVVLLAVYEIVLYRYTHQRDLIIGTASSGRSQGRFKGVVGNSGRSARSANEARRRSAVFGLPAGGPGQRAPSSRAPGFPLFRDLERLRPERVEGRWPIFQTWFALQQAQSDVEEGAIRW